jgi:Endonuclease-reverse transcriptase
VILINVNLLTDAWKQINIKDLIIMVIEIQGQFGTLHIINIYNDGNNNNMLTHISAYMQDQERQQHAAGPLHTMWLGDFNHHHPLWDEAHNAHLFTTQNLDLTQPLLNMLGPHNMKMVLPLQIPTLQSHSTRNHTRVDNVFCMENLANMIIKYNMEDAARPVKTDHYLIIMQIDIYALKTAWKLRHNFRKADQPELVQTLKANLTNIPPHRDRQHTRL